MSWYPIGPDFVFAPRRADFKRLSRRNEWPRQGMVNCIAIDPFDVSTIYVTEGPKIPGASAFRTSDGGNSWKPIADSLQQGDPLFDPSCIVIDPADSNIVYLATFKTRHLVRSDDRGETWSPKQILPDHAIKLLIDPFTAGTPETTVMYVATTTGVYRSASGGVTGSWTQVLPDEITALIAVPSGMGSVLYAAVLDKGIFRSSDPISPGNWTNLNTQGVGLPAHRDPSTAEPNGNFSRIDLDFCPSNPARIYAMFYQDLTAGQLFTTTAADASWTEIAMTSPSRAGHHQNLPLVFAVAPNSPGDSIRDILFFGDIEIHRSIDSGRSWVRIEEASSTSVYAHADPHALAFYPPNPMPGVIPAMFIGDDGGLSRNDHLADPGFSLPNPPQEYNESDIYLSDAAATQNLNHGKQSSAIIYYSGEPATPSLGYIGCVDTGIAASSGSLGWRGLTNADFYSIAAARGTDSVIIWAAQDIAITIIVWKDTGGYSFAAGTEVKLGFDSNAPALRATSNFILGLDNNCIGGVLVLDSATSLLNAITTTGRQRATPVSMENIAVGGLLTISDANGVEKIVVTGVTATTFSANFTRTFSAGARVELTRRFVVRIDHQAIPSIISQDFAAADNEINIVARSPRNADLLVAAIATRLWITHAGATASGTTIWSEATDNKPSPFSSITGIAINASDEIYVLVSVPVQSVTPSGTTIRSPLFKINGLAWEHQSCVGLPAGRDLSFGRLLADPVEADVFYAIFGGSVFRIAKSGTDWEWIDMSEGLPGGVISDLWIADFGSPGAPIVILRAALPSRGIWEIRPALRDTMPAVELYMRDNILDQALLPRSPDSVANPFRPSELVFHYQSADVKVDVEHPHRGHIPAFFQTTPEAPVPLNHVFFDQLKDNSLQIPSGGRAYIHAQVHNRGRLPADNVQVWAIYCNASAGVPALNLTADLSNAFPFWDQFTVAGEIVPNLPKDSPWASVGPPVTLSGIDPANPQIASWLWTAPVLSGRPEGQHYCIAVFVHSSDSPINETGMSVDEMTSRNKQVAQKNVHILGELPEEGNSAPEGGTGARRRFPPAYIEFHNASAKTIHSEFIFDLSRLPQAIRTRAQFAELKSEKPLKESASGISGIVKMPAGRSSPFSIAGIFGRLLLSIVRCLSRLAAKLLGTNIEIRCEKRTPVNFLPFGFEISGSQRAVFSGIVLEPFSHAVARIYLENLGTLESDKEHRFDVLHFSDRHFLGGCTYVVPVQGRRPVAVIDSQWPGEDDSHWFAPPHMTELTKERRLRFGKPT